MRITTFYALGAALLLQGALSAYADEATTTQRAAVETSFASMVATSGSTYMSLRSNITLRGELVVPILTAKRASTNLHDRVMAGGMLSWIRETERCRDWVEQNKNIVSSSPNHIKGTAWGILNACGLTYRHRSVAKLNDSTFEPYHLELALKQAWPSNDSTASMEESEAFWAQCYAAGVLGLCKGPDVLPVLRELSGSPHWELRAACAMSLRYLNTLEAADVLFAMVADANEEVRRICRVGIKDLTDQDFGNAPEKYQQWWLENKQRWPFVDRKPGEKSIRLIR